MAGPMTNFVLAGLFLLLIFTPFKVIGLFGAQINSFLGLFNMLPFLNIDGKKILNWNKSVYIFMVILGIVLISTTFLI